MDALKASWVALLVESRRELDEAAAAAPRRAGPPDTLVDKVLRRIDLLPILAATIFDKSLKVVWWGKGKEIGCPAGELAGEEQPIQASRCPGCALLSVHAGR